MFCQTTSPYQHTNFPYFILFYLFYLFLSSVEGDAVVCLEYYDYNVGCDSHQLRCNIECFLFCLAGELRGSLSFTAFNVFPVNV